MDYKKTAIRHGDLVLIKIKSLPEDIVKKEMPVAAAEIMRGSRGKPHLVKNGIVYQKRVDDFVFGYLEAKENCVLLHEEHGKKVKGRGLREAVLAKGFYELRNQVEQTHEGMRIVED